MSSSSSYPGSLDSVRGLHRAPRAGAASAKKSSFGVDVGVDGGRVEDGSAWSMIARFQCSVPGCGASFTRKQNLRRHQTQKHGRPKAHARGTADDYHLDDDDDDDDDGDSGMMPAFY